MFKEVNEQILKLIEKNSRLTPEEIASLLEIDVDEVKRRIKEMEESQNYLWLPYINQLGKN
jgi:transcriptional regulator, AsnC family